MHTKTNKNRMFKKLPNHIIVLLFFSLSFILFSYWIFFHASDYLINIGIKKHYATINSDKGVIGDTFGGTLGPFIAWIAAILTFAAFWVQYRANEQQSEYIKQQRFEDIFFRLLENHQRIVESMDLSRTQNRNEVIARSRDVFKMMYKRFISQHKKTFEDKNIENTNITYHLIQEKYKSDLHHYFRFLYHILKFIKNSDISDNDKYKYASILRATLSAYEIIFIFYNCLHDNGSSHFKPLVEEFSFLKNIDTSLLISNNHEDQFHRLAFASSGQRSILLKEWHLSHRNTEQD